LGELEVSETRTEASLDDGLVASDRAGSYGRGLRLLVCEPTSEEFAEGRFSRIEVHTLTSFVAALIAFAFCGFASVKRAVPTPIALAGLLRKLDDCVPSPTFAVIEPVAAPISFDNLLFGLRSLRIYHGFMLS
jgi:hypothetical protein